MSSQCTIPGNPDIAGIGVRIAIYIQNLLCFAPALWALWDGEVTQEELDSAETQTTTNLVLAFAILISSIVQALTLGLSNYHASIVLSMSWMNNTNAFIYFILYIHHKRRSVRPTWTSWYAHVRGKFDFLLPHSGTTFESRANRINGSSHHERDESSDGRASHTASDNLEADGRSGAKTLVKRFVILLGTLHLTLMAALGIWVWSDLRSFGNSRVDKANLNDCAASLASVAIVGQGVPMGAKALSVFSVTFYALFLIPGLNLVLPITLFLSLYFWFHRRYLVDDANGKPTENWAAFPAFAGLVVLFAVNIIFIVDIEATLRWNERLQLEDEKQWGFGQILAILLLFLPLRDLAETLLERRTKRRRGEIAAELKGAIESKEIDAVFRAVERGADLKKALDIEEKHSSIAWMLQLAVMKRYQRIIEIVVHCPTADINLVNETGSTALMVACDRSWSEMDDDRIPQILLDQPAINVNAADRQGKTALMKACWRGNELVVQHLLEHRLTDVNLQDDNGESALTMSASLGFIAIVRRLLRRPDIDVNKANNLGRTALMEASAQGHDSVVGELLGYQPTDVNLQDNGGDTALVLASRAGAVPVVVSLLRHSHIDINKVNLQGSTALMEASHKGHGPVVQELLLQPSIQIELRDDHGSTALILASGAAHPSAAMALLQHPNIDTNTSNKSGRTALMQASQAGNVTVIHELLKRQPTDVNRRDKDGNTALIVASYTGHVAALVALLQHPELDVNMAEQYGYTALMLAFKQEDAVVELLKHRNINVNATTEGGGTALVDASYAGCTSSVKALLQHPDIDVNLSSDQGGQTALMVACLNGHEPIVKELLKQQALNVNLRNHGYGSTALMQAAKEGYGSIVTLLLDHPGIDADLKNNDGQTALHLALERGHEQVAQLLSRVGAASGQG